MNWPEIVRWIALFVAMFYAAEFPGALINHLRGGAGGRRLHFATFALLIMLFNIMLITR